MERTLIVDEKYHGKYVALKSRNDSTVVGCGKDPREALNDAKKRGYLHPYIMFVPEKELAPTF